MPQQLVDIIGKKIGSWTVLRRGPNDQFGKTRWWCRCNCDNERLVLSSNLRHGGSNKCKACAQFKGCGDISSKYWSQLQRHAQTRNNEFGITIQEVWNLFLTQARRCALTGRLIRFARQYGRDEQTASLDRIDSSRGYVRDNIQWIHKDVNSLKGNLNEEKFISLCRLVADYRA
jgi:hypothetical protein